ncbi:MAG: CAP domain-containing protein, partial [Sulfitobacter sp.]
MSNPNQYEIQMLDLMNAERQAAGLNPLVFNNDLNEASEDHSRWMLDTDTFSHTGVDGSSSRARIESAGYELEGSWRTGENIGWVSEGGADGLSDEVIRLHENLMNSPGHRANILNPDFEEVGLGIEEGDFARPNGSVDAVFVTQNFGTTDAVADAPVADAAVVDQTPAMPEAVLDVMPDVPDLQEQAPAAADLDFGSFDAFMASFRDFRPSMVDAGNDMDSESSGFMTTTGSTISGVTVTSTADTIDGPTTEIEGEGTFTGTGTATVDMETVTDTQSGGADVADTAEPAVQMVEPAIPAEEPVMVLADSEMDTDESGFTTTNGTTTSSATVTSIADTVNGPTINIEGEGTFTGTGTATVDMETVTDTQSGGANVADTAEP